MPKQYLIIINNTKEIKNIGNNEELSAMSVTDQTQPFIESPSGRQQLHWRKKNHI